MDGRGWAAAFLGWGLGTRLPPYLLMDPCIKWRYWTGLLEFHAHKYTIMRIEINPGTGAILHHTYYYWWLNGQGSISAPSANGRFYQLTWPVYTNGKFTSYYLFMVTWSFSNSKPSDIVILLTFAPKKRRSRIISYSTVLLLLQQVMIWSHRGKGQPIETSNPYIHNIYYIHT